MIRLVHQRLIIPRGDTGSLSVPLLSINTQGANLIAVFSIFNSFERIFQKEIQVEGNTLEFNFTTEETKDLPVGMYNWDIKIYVNPQYNDNGLLINGDEVHSYYAGFGAPECEIALAPIHERG